ncbi:MAG: hypothetical protein V4650_09820 [Pseudomonadota bacterium]
MLFALMSVLVPLLIGFFALWLGAVGRVGADQQELSVPGRALLIGVALVAFGIAYGLYNHARLSNINEVAAAPVPLPAKAAEVSEALPPEPAVPTQTLPAVAVVSNAEILPASESVDATEDSEPTATSPVLSAAAARLEAQSRLPDHKGSVIAGHSRPAPLAPAASRELMRDEPIQLAAPALAPAPAKSSPRRAGSQARRSARHQPLTLHIHNRLGRDQLREQLTLSIEGKPVARIEVDDSQPAAFVAVPLPRPGLLHYRLEGVSEDDGRSVLVGEGCIRVRDGARFDVRRRDGSGKVFLQASRTGPRG